MHEQDLREHSKNGSLTDMSSDDCCDVDEQIVISANSRRHKIDILSENRGDVLQETYKINEENYGLNVPTTKKTNAKVSIDHCFMME